MYAQPGFGVLQLRPVQCSFMWISSGHKKARIQTMCAGVWIGVRIQLLGGKEDDPSAERIHSKLRTLWGIILKKKSLLRTGKRRQGQLSRYIQASYQQFFYALSIPCPDLLLLGMLFPSIQRCLKSCHNTGWEIFLLLLSHALNSKGNLAEGKMVIPRQFQELLYCQVEK